MPTRAPEEDSGASKIPSALSALAPFRHRDFSLLWIATLVANVGTWMYSAAAGWLMTSLNPETLVVSLVQVAMTLPILLFALADIVDNENC